MYSTRPTTRATFWHPLDPAGRLENGLEEAHALRQRRTNTLFAMQSRWLEELCIHLEHPEIDFEKTGKDWFLPQ